MDSAAEAEYAAFEERVKRTVYLDNLSPQVTEAVIKTALNQFGNVTNVQFITNYLEFHNIPRCALVEMENSKQAKEIIETLGNLPFMMSGMPRPIRARRAEVEMFDNRPRKPGRKIHCRWLDPTDPDFEVATQLKALTREHNAEASFLLEHQLAEEERLAKQQGDTLKSVCKKYGLVDGVFVDGSAKRLAHHYGVNINDA